MKVVRASWLFLLVFASSAGAALAQDTTPKVGVFGGFNQSYFATSPKSDTEASQGLLVGAFAILRREKYLKIQPEVQVSQRRAVAIYSGTAATYSTTYVNLGLMLRIKLFGDSYTTQGVQYSTPIRASLKVPGGTGDVKNNIANDVSLVVGGGYQFSQRFGFEVRWDSGFKGVEEIPLGGYVKRNRAITFMGIFGF